MHTVFILHHLSSSPALQLSLHTALGSDPLLEQPSHAHKVPAQEGMQGESSDAKLFFNIFLGGLIWIPRRL